ncbi:MAG: hypothetical protein NTW71_06975 [Deltaproteobacteria bacterium]|nr:hypothetical protein [Deltaproteobacteria bacterium]
MIIFPYFFSKPPSLKQLPLKRYLINFSLDRLALGVDNIHIDVHISPQVLSAVKRAVYISMIKHSQSEYFFEDHHKDPRENEKLALKNVCIEVLLEGINNAKSKSEVQIDFLGQAALAKMFLEEIGNAYRKLVTNFETLMRDFELSRRYDQVEWLKMKEKLTEIKHNQRRIVRVVGKELFQVLADVHAKNLKNIRESNFPVEYILPDNFFINPTLHTDNVADDFFLADAYVLLGQRSDEPNNYNSLKSIIDGLLGKTDLEREGATDGENENRETKEADILSDEGNALDPWLMGIDNIDLMFNCFDSKEQYKKAKEQKEPKSILLELKSRMKIQEKLLNLFYRKFKKSRLLKLIVAAYEMKPVYQNFCPPLRPMQIREYLVKPGSRKSIVRELQRRKSFKVNSLLPLQETIRRIKGSSTRNKKEHLLSFLKDFLRYHRDLKNGRLLKQAMDAINLVTDKNILLLSKKNQLLYEYLLPEERVKEEKPIISHVVIKADIRGSMDITHTMRVRGLNPASYFSLNFFDPISEILCDYDASKVFIEGDAIILSIFENEDTAQGWYSVARACGLAVNMVNIVRQYNVKNQEHDLPILELGIGICYKQSPPAFLFDGDSRIMISHAINLADRLSSCDKKLRKCFKKRDRMFNLFVFQNVRDEDIEATADDLFLRYNVNGIELDREGFAKLSKEINLKSVVYPTENNEKVTLYTGKVPTLSGKYQRLVIREAAIMEVKPETMDVIGPTSRTYYEVCTQPAIYEFIDNHS